MIQFAMSMDTNIAKASVKVAKIANAYMAILAILRGRCCMQERRLTPLSTVKPSSIHWLWPNRLPLGAVSVLEGDPGLAKSTISYDLAARVSAGKPMPNCTGHPSPAGVILLQAEDGLDCTVLPTLRAMGANLDRIHVYDRVRFGDHPLVLPGDLPLLEVAAGEIQARLLVIDPLSAFGGGNINADQSIRRTLAPLAAFAAQANLAVLIIRHLAKTGTPNPKYRGAGSIAVTAAARSVLTVMNDPNSDDPHQHLLVPPKNNLANPTSLAYRTVRDGDILTVQWLGESPYTSGDLAAAGRDESSMLREAMYVLYSILKDGPVWSSDAIRLAGKAGVAKRTLDRAKKMLGVITRRRASGTNSHWYWELPQNEFFYQALKARDHDDLMDQLIYGDEDPPLPGDEWKKGQLDDDGWKKDLDDDET